VVVGRSVQRDERSNAKWNLAAREKEKPISIVSARLNLRLVSRDKWGSQVRAVISFLYVTRDVCLSRSPFCPFFVSLSFSLSLSLFLSVCSLSWPSASSFARVTSGSTSRSGRRTTGDDQRTRRTIRQDLVVIIHIVVIRERSAILLLCNFVWTIGTTLHARSAFFSVPSCRAYKWALPDARRTLTQRFAV